MSQTFVLVGLFVAGVACLPFLVRWAQARTGSGGQGGGQAKVLSVVAVGPHQRVVTLQVASGPKEAVLVLGVTASSVNCLHKWESGASVLRPVDGGVNGAVQNDGK